MKATQYFFTAAVLMLGGEWLKAQTPVYHEQYRPQLHFSPKAHWTNDPNGMVYFDHTYHLFFQYYPNGTIWGPMHWGHAESPDMIHWKEMPIALYPDSLGYIFSGSAVVDSNNTSGFGKDGKIPLVAIFTHHDPVGEKLHHDNFQNQSLAYSLDNGSTWTKYSGNPVLHNPGITDFRDPKVSWFATQKKWVMTLATKDHITFYSSPNLKSWTKESEFGQNIGAHGGVWECPDLFPLKLNGKTHWVLIVNINPGGPNGGSATQYFIGQFDGKTFTPIDTKIRWVDYGPDEYAGITWSNTGKRHIFLGWMSNWDYANQVPTVAWRNAMTIPRELSLANDGNELILASKPVAELNKLNEAPQVFKLVGTKTNLLTKSTKQFRLRFALNQTTAYAVTLSNTRGDKLIIGYDAEKKSYYIDRKAAGENDFNKSFARMSYSPRLSGNKAMNADIVIDATSAEAFFDNGTSVMTSLFFPHEPFSSLYIQTSGNIKPVQASITPLATIWK